MANIERRIAALEARIQTASSPLELVLVRNGEAEADALKRAGAPSNAIVVVFCSPLDAHL